MESQKPATALDSKHRQHVTRVSAREAWQRGPPQGAAGRREADLLHVRGLCGSEGPGELTDPELSQT